MLRSRPNHNRSGKDISVHIVSLGISQPLWRQPFDPLHEMGSCHALFLTMDNFRLRTLDLVSPPDCDGLKCLQKSTNPPIHPEEEHEHLARSLARQVSWDPFFDFPPLLARNLVSGFGNGRERERERESGRASERERERAWRQLITRSP